MTSHCMRCKKRPCNSSPISRPAEESRQTCVRQCTGYHGNSSRHMRAAKGVVHGTSHHGMIFPDSHLRPAPSVHRHVASQVCQSLALFLALPSTPSNLMCLVAPSGIVPHNTHDSLARSTETDALTKPFAHLNHRQQRRRKGCLAQCILHHCVCTEWHEWHAVRHCCQPTCYSTFTTQINFTSGCKPNFDIVHLERRKT